MRNLLRHAMLAGFATRRHRAGRALPTQRNIYLVLTSHKQGKGTAHFSELLA